MPVDVRGDRRPLVWLLVTIAFAMTLGVSACAPDRPEPTKRGDALPEGTFDPEAWGEEYPEQYEDWQKTAEPRSQGSRYKKGGEQDVAIRHDKLSEYPFLAAMAKGIGFSVEFNEPRGHALALIDQHEIDPARLKAGGVCLACKSPYYETLLEQEGERLYSMPYQESVELIPEEHRELGVSCADCHKPQNADLTYSELMADALKRIGTSEVPEGQMKNAVCGQCHSTYTIPKREGASVGLFMPWDGGSYGDISVENMIEVIESDPANMEWQQEITGLRLGYIRHPEFELYTKNSQHYRNGVTCPDCHQPYRVKRSEKVSDHNVMSPLDNDMRACRPCHPSRTAEQLRDSVFHVQDNFIGGLLNAGYSVVSNAQLIRMANDSKVDTTTVGFSQAVAAYKQAFYRVAYLSAENSVGFHNSPEAFRILTDAQAYCQRSETILRSELASAGADVPTEVDLQLRTYIENRGERRLQFEPDQEFKDPRGIVEKLWPENLARLRGGANSED